ncbi:MAG: hypothetical protein ACK5TA_07145, partial [bacterium]
GSHEFVMRAGGVLITASGEKNFHVRKFKIAAAELSMEEVDEWKFPKSPKIMTFWDNKRRDIFIFMCSI